VNYAEKYKRGGLYRRGKRRAGNAKQIFDEASNYGDIIVKRIFADWSKAALKNWREEINRYSITAEQQFGIVSKKNCSDIALIIQTMVVLFEKG